MRARVMAAVAAALSCVAGAAQAVTYTITYAGQASGFYGELFGLGVGFGSYSAPFTAAVSINTGLPGALVAPDNASIGTLGPGVLSATITIGGISYTLGDDVLSSSVREQDGFPGGADVHLADFSDAALENILNPGGAVIGRHDVVGALSLQLNSTFTDFVDGDIRTNLPTLTLGSLIGSAGQIIVQDTVIDFVGGGSTTRPVADLFLRVDSVNATPTATVPEPAAWATMIMGFAAAGIALRRRRLAV